MALTVLVVEDEARTRSLVSRRLQAAGYRVVESGSAEDALAAYPVATPDLVLIDIVLPGKSGLDLIDELQKQFPEARVVAMSGALDADVPTLLRQSRERGAVLALAKPFTTERLLDVVDQALRAPAEPATTRIEKHVPAPERVRWGLLAALGLVVLAMFLIALMRG